MRLAVTGHRPGPKLGGWNSNPLRTWIKQQIGSYLDELEPALGISGMALGIDQDFAWACVERDIPFLAAVPFKGQELIWPMVSQREYNRLLSCAKEVVYVCEPGYEAWKMITRNQYMVDNSDHLLAVFDGTPGGTAKTYNYAIKQKKPITRINPDTWRSQPR